MKIYTIFTGGTIGSRISEDGRITIKDSTPYTLLNAYRSRYNRDIEFVFDEPYCILSENLSAVNIKTLISCVARAVSKQDIDGIIITHGTDTLQYSAALLAYLFGVVRLPIILVSSDYPLADKRANGLLNFRYALEFIQGGYGSGVFVSYFNKGQMPVIHRGTRLLQHLPFSADVMSVADSWYGRFENESYIANSHYRAGDGKKAMFEDIANVKLHSHSDEIIRIIPYVGMTYPRITEKTRAVLHESFHSGTISISEDLEKFMDEANQRRIPVFLSGLSKKETEYETVSRYRALGIRPLCESAPIAQYCKLWLAVSNGENLDKIMDISVAEDFV